MKRMNLELASIILNISFQYMTYDRTSKLSKVLCPEKTCKKINMHHNFFLHLNVTILYNNLKLNFFYFPRNKPQLHNIFIFHLHSDSNTNEIQWLPAPSTQTSHQLPIHQLDQTSPFFQFIKKKKNNNNKIFNKIQARAN